MVAYPCKRFLVDPILDGIKDGTIRADRVRGHAQLGQGVQLYVDMRQPSCALILRSVCVATFPVRLIWRPVVEVIVDGEKLPTAEFDAFARRDGFIDFDGMERFWAENHPGLTIFPGTLVRWQAPTSRVAMGATIALPAKDREAA